MRHRKDGTASETGKDDDTVIYDISQPLFECRVFPGDPGPEKTELQRISDGAICNLTAISLCVHNGTHIDAPYHFMDDGKGVDRIDLSRFIGPAYVETRCGDVTGPDAEQILGHARAADGRAWKKILIKGNATVTQEAASVFADAGIDLIGNESQTVGPEEAPMAVHLILLRKEVVLLEGIRLAHVPDGAYLLNCAPLNLTGTDGSPCRAVLTDL